ncbi:MAG TPA: ribosomal protein S18-alanine N-acetyltransferase [Nocardioidaceae bacterium]|nr:ribosomal protein S18-alanine N-acetyltransferase [Nocardioidaceae bacterium]
MIVRAARPSDVSEVSALEAELFGRDAWSPKLVEAELTHSLRTAVVAVVGANIVGYAIVLQVADTTDLQRIGVSLHHQRRGVALALLNALDLDMHPRVLLEVRTDNAPAIALYQSVGFATIATRRGYYADGGDALLMRREGRQVAAHAAAHRPAG